MKTTVELSNELATQAKTYAASHSTTLRALIEQGLRHTIKAYPQQKTFTLRDASVDGQGLQTAFADASWDAISQAIYMDHQS